MATLSKPLMVAVVEDDPRIRQLIEDEVVDEGHRVDSFSTAEAFLDVFQAKRFDLVLLSAQRAREISGGAELTVDRDRDKTPVVALREIAEQTVMPKELHESVVLNLQKILPDDEDEADDIGSLSQSAEAMRLSAAAPTRSTSIGADYDG